MWLNPQQFFNELNLVSSILPHGGIMVDVGTNVDHFTFDAYTALGKQGRVIAFEPHPRIFLYLTKNLQFNDYPQVSLSCMALSDRCGKASREDSRWDDMNSLTELSNPTDARVIVRTTTLDEALAADSRVIHLLKIDVEGAEMMVLRGASHTLKRTEALMVEAGDLNTLRFGSRASDLLTFLRSQGFHVRTTTGNQIEPHPEDFTGHVGNWLTMRDVACLSQVL